MMAPFLFRERRLSRLGRTSAGRTVPGPSLHRVYVQINRLAPLKPQCRLRQLQHRVVEGAVLRLQRYDLLLSPIP